MENIINAGCERAITGPAIRGDMVTLDRHMKVLDEQERILYQALTDVILDMKEKIEGNENYNSYL